MAIGNGELVHECFAKYSRVWEQGEEPILTQTEEETMKRGVHEYLEGSKPGTNKRSPDGLSQPNQNRIFLNIT